MKIQKMYFAMAMLLCSLLLAGCKNPFDALSEVKLEKTAVTLARETISGGYKLITAEELHKKIMENNTDQNINNDILIVDTMPFADSYAKNHISSALQFAFPIAPMNTWNTQETEGKSIEDFKAMLGNDLNRPIVFYCGFVACTRSHNGAVWAKKLGYTNIYRMPGGIFAWKEAGYDIGKIE